MNIAEKTDRSRLTVSAADDDAVDYVYEGPVTGALASMLGRQVMRAT